MKIAAEVVSLLRFHGPLYMVELANHGDEMPPWLEGCDDDDLVCFQWDNCTMIVRAHVARAWTELMEEANGGT